MSEQFYNGNTLLNKKDLTGAQPEIYICTSNRNAGKTTFFSRYLVDSYLKKGEEFAVLYRYKDDIKGADNKFFHDIQELFYKDLEMYGKAEENGLFMRLFINGNTCGYALPINKADKLKRNSHLFSHVEHIFFDEFQSEFNDYCPSEITKFISLHTSIARGQGKAVRRVPVYLVGNPVTMLNPYYAEFGVAKRLDKKTKFLRGNGWVMEQGFNHYVAEQQKLSAFNRAFENHEYVSYASEGTYLNDSDAFIEAPSGNSSYFMTLLYKGKNYGIRKYVKQGIVHCGHKPDMSSHVRLSATTDSHTTNYVMLKTFAILIDELRFYFQRGAFRFEDLECKNVILDTLAFH